MTEIAGVSLRTVHRVRAEVEARPAEAAAYRDLGASILEAEPGLKTLEVLRRLRLVDYGGGKSALYELVREQRPRAVYPVARF